MLSGASYARRQVSGGAPRSVPTVVAVSSNDLAFLVSRYRAVEILDALTDRPFTLHDLRIATHASRRALARTVRLLAAHGLIHRTHPGSWDRLHTGRYDLTPAGRALADCLSVLDVWVDLYEHHL